MQSKYANVNLQMNASATATAAEKDLAKMAVAAAFYASDGQRDFTHSLAKTEERVKTIPSTSI